MVGAKYNGEGLPVPEDCPATIGRLMKSCWSNLPSNRPSFGEICSTLEEAAEGWLEESRDGRAGAGASPLGQEHQGGVRATAIVSRLQEEEESTPGVDQSVGSPDSAGGSDGGRTTSGKPRARCT